MKAMNEFQSVLVIASLILTACAIIDVPRALPRAEVITSAGAYAGHAAPSAVLATQKFSDMSGSRAAGGTMSVASLEADNDRRRLSTLQIRLPLQAPSSW
jgi:hypothetical protein